eukprot:CAMPEP_0196804696 /NCGR_PEP_ID=MMETSP1362-20130617/4368_1 /TAXON_ID=163516 /ORGANISM="Leptocylindrus danicus, Strain CCMP1856" /LENGTH=204 /DNA_ID=CAMNT_0042177165 /DNA_START=51 /DNA_END=662 /DNA_ORIENTATION=+
MASSSSLIIDGDGNLDVDLLSREIAGDLSFDTKYKNEDSMKKRAIHSSKDYDEFRAFVACSHLKPLKGNEMSQLLQPGKGAAPLALKQPSMVRKGKKFNRRNERSCKKLVKSANEEFPSSAADTCMKFQRDWDRYCSTIDKRIQYLRLFPSPITAAKSIFSVEMDAIIMCDIINALSVLTNDDEYGRLCEDDNCTSMKDLVLEW